MTSTHTAAAAPGVAPRPEPRIAFTHEVRFAVVMYGGVSLAIYMNGVAQELLRLVRATAPASKGSTRPRLKDDELKGTEAVYRELGQMLTGSWPLSHEEVSKEEQPEIRTRFVVDVISGTSAGGINGVFLAKALANDQSMDELTKLWIREGDFDRLMNDGGARGRQSLLDGTHMYRELLRALKGMDDGRPRPARSPYVEELDLFVTATDIRGLPLPLQLAGDVIDERRHRNVFHFSCTPREVSGESSDRNDFVGENDPFLAFAARCTSSFPVAFEPMRLRDIDPIVRAEYPNKRDDDLKSMLADSEGWRAFFEDYLGAEAREAQDFVGRAFGDGGYLDNKPFSYATDTLLRRRNSLPVSRKLIFVDPDPQGRSAEPKSNGRVDVLENTRSALSPTASTETIREDIQRILERNRLIERVRRVTQDVELDILAREKRGRRWRSAHAAPVNGDVWAKQDLSDMIARKGVAYGGYHRLKVATVVDELATFVVNAMNLRRDSDEFVAVRYFIEAWLERTYAKARAGDQPTQNRFLMDFDLGFRLRRLNFVREKISELLSSDMDALKTVARLTESPFSEDSPSGPLYFLAHYQDELRRVQPKISHVYANLLRVQREFRAKGKKNRLHDLLASAELDKKALGDVLNNSTDEECRAAARNYLDMKPAALAAIEAAAGELRSTFKSATVRASSRCAILLDMDMRGKAPDDMRAARQPLWWYYQRFEDYDMVIFPVTSQAGVGETSRVDVIRVSPFDAKNLIDESKKDGRRKLGGTALGHFGAFFSEVWRKNDIMWGRLDAAERIITTLLPKGHADRDALIDEAHRAILREEVLPEGHGELRGGFVRALLSAGAAQAARDGSDGSPAVKHVLRQLAETPPGNASLNSVLNSLVDSPDDPTGLLRYFKGKGRDGDLQDACKGYEVDRTLDAATMIRLMARSTKVFGLILESLTESQHDKGSKNVAWVTRLGQVFWGLVEMAVPGSFRNRFFRHWIKLPYVLSALLLVLGTVLLYSDMQVFGLVTLTLTAATHFGVMCLGAYMRGKGSLLRPIFSLFLGLLMFAAGGLALFGAYSLYAKVLALAERQPAVGGMPVWIVVAYKLWSAFCDLPPLPRVLCVVAVLELLFFLAAVTYASVRYLFRAAFIS